MKIMIVDDHADIRILLRSMLTLAQKKFLSKEDYLEVVEFESGEEAIVQYSNEAPDFLLMDIELKTMSGFTAVSTILKQDPEAKIIMVTGYDNQGFRSKAKKLGALGFVSKENLTEINQILKDITIQA